MKEMERRRQQPDTGTITELQLEMGRLKCDLRTKVRGVVRVRLHDSTVGWSGGQEEIVQDLVQRIQDRENEQAITCDRASSAEGMVRRPTSTKLLLPKWSSSCAHNVTCMRTQCHTLILHANTHTHPHL